MLTNIGEIRREEGCIDYAGRYVMVYPCHGMKGNQEWIYGTVCRHSLFTLLRDNAETTAYFIANKTTTSREKPLVLNSLDRHQMGY